MTPTDQLSSPTHAVGYAGKLASEFERECVEFFGGLVQILGVPRSVGQIFGLLFASQRPLSFTDIVEQLEISKGSASQGLQLLRTLGAVRSSNISEDRRERFLPELGLRRLISGVVREKIDPLLSGGGAHMRRLREYARKTPDTQSSKFALQRVEQLEKWRRQIRLLLPMLKTFLLSNRV